MFGSLRKSMKDMFASFDKMFDDLEHIEDPFKKFDKAFENMPKDAQEQRTVTEETRPDGTRIVTTTILRRTTTMKTTQTTPASMLTIATSTIVLEKAVG